MAKNNINAINRAASFNPQQAFPLDKRSYFESLVEAEAAASTAAEPGTDAAKNTTYYYGQTIAVNEGGKATFYIIQPDKTLKEIADFDSINIEKDEEGNAVKIVDNDDNVIALIDSNGLTVANIHTPNIRHDKDTSKMYITGVDVELDGDIVLSGGDLEVEGHISSPRDLYIEPSGSTYIKSDLSVDGKIDCTELNINGADLYADYQTIALGDHVGASGSISAAQSVLVGGYSSANTTAGSTGQVVAAGYYSVGGLYGTAVGAYAAGGDYGTVIGKGSSNTRGYGFAGGYNAIAGYNSIAIGYQAGTGAGSITSSIMIGRDATISDDTLSGSSMTGNGIAIGYSANTNYYGVAIGYNTSLCQGYGVAIGGGTEVNSRFGVAIGWNAFVDQIVTHTYTGEYSVAIGASSGALGVATAIGNLSYSYTGGVSLGASAKANGLYGIAIGYKAQTVASGALNTNSIAIGTSSYSDMRSIAIGGNAKATLESSTGDPCIVIGENIDLLGNNTIAIGGNAGNGNTAAHIDAVMIGTNTQVKGQGGIAIGNDAQIMVENSTGSMAIGYSSNAYQSANAVGYLSVAATASNAFGYNAKANNYYTLAVGTAYAGGTGSTVVGNGASSSYSYATILGRSSYVNSNCGTVVGYNATAGGTNAASIAMGYQAQAIGNTYGAIAVGTFSQATGCGAIAIGTSSKAYNNISYSSSGYGSIAIGNYSFATGPYGCITIGPSAQSYYASTAIGRNTRAYGGYSIAIGYGATAGSSSYTGTTAASSGAYSIAIGNGAYATYTGSKSLIKIGTSSCYYYYGGESTTWSSGSDERDKINIQPIYGGIALIKNIQPISFQYNYRTAYSDSGSLLDYDIEEHALGTKAHDDLKIGFSAQEVAKYFDENYGTETVNNIVEHNYEVDSETGQTEDIYAISEGGFIPFLFQAIKEQQDIIESLEQRIKILETTINNERVD